MSASKAVVILAENEGIIDPHGDPVTFNLNAGMLNLAYALQNIENSLSSLAGSIRDVETSVKSKAYRQPR